MRFLAAAVLAAASAAAFAPAADAAPRLPAASAPVAADVQIGVGAGVAPRPVGYRWVGGYYRTEYRYVWTEGPVAYVTAFGRVVRHAGHGEWVPYRVWVPYSVRYARPYTRPGMGFGTALRTW